MTYSPMKRWLIASLVLNVLLAAAIAGGVLRWWSGQHGGGHLQSHGLRFAADELSSEQRQAYRSGLRQVRREAAALIEAARANRQAVLELLRSPELDRVALLGALARSSQADAALRARFETSVIDFAATLDAKDRQKFVSGLARQRNLGAPRAPSPTP